MSRVQQQSRRTGATAERLARKSSGRPTAARKPAYLQKRMSVSSPGDAQEREADRVAEEVTRAASAGGTVATPAPAARTIGRISETEAANPLRRQEEEEAQTRLQRQEEEEAQTQVRRQEEEEELQTRVQRQEEEEELQTSVQRQEEEEETLQTRLQRQAEDEEETLQTQLSRMEEEEEAAQTSLMRQGEEEEEAAQMLSRQEEEEEALQAARKIGGQELDRATEERIDALRGNGNPLPEDVRLEMQQRFGHDFSGVNVHTGGEAADLCRKLHARAFTVGQDVFFAPGEFAPETEQGRKLLAHELTHVVQQGGGVSRRVYRNTGASTGTATGASGGGSAGGPNPPAGVQPILPSPEGRYEFDLAGKRYRYLANTAPKELHLPEVRIPNFKQRHQALHPTPLDRDPGARDTNQRQAWRDHFSTTVVGPLHQTLDSAERRRGFSGDGAERRYFFKGTRNQRLMLFGTRESLLEPAIFPFWDRRQQTRTFQVDHCREDQLGGEDRLQNYELLDAGANGSSGSRIAHEINSQIGSAVGVLQSPYYRSVIGAGNQRISGNPSYIKEHYRLQFDRVRYNLGGVENGDRYWSVEQITAGEHLRQFRPLTAREVEQLGDGPGTLLFTSPMGGIPIRAPRSAGQRVEIWPRVFATGPLQIVDDQHATLPVDAYRSGQNTNSLQAGYPDLSFQFQPIPGVDGWAIDKASTLQLARQSGSGGVFQSLRLPGLSPIRVDELDLDPGLGFVGRGKLLPSVPLLAQADIDVVIQGGEIRLQKTFSFDEIGLPPPLEIHHSSITAFVGTGGLGVEGVLGFGLDRLGEGELRAEISSRAGFALSGQFAFDERIFGEGSSAEVRVAYRESQWSMGGTLTVPEGRVRGVRSATIDVNYAESEGFSARGEAELDVPGVESGTLAVTQSESEGFVISGSFSLSPDTPGIRGGQISASVREKPDGSGYAVSASGEAQPDIPGINSNLRVEYDDGAFTASVTAQYARGMLSGQIEAGATNRTLDAEGNPTGEPGDTIVVFGGGSLTIQIAPWLQGTAGVEFAPNGELTVRGEIGLPDQLEIFARREINKSIFNIAVQAPIVPGIVAEIGGGLSANAGIGPGVIDELRIGIEYNPEREEDTHVTGDAHLNVPADAGLRLSVRAGIGLGITGASATGGLEIGGTLGISGAAEAGVHLDWMPSRGLEINANVGVHAQPSFRFDLSGYVSVRALGFSVYDERFELASFEFGSDYRFGINLPVHYVEGQPFDISLDDVEFEVPDIDTNQLLRGLISRVT